jgi:hypothetical protein
MVYIGYICEVSFPALDKVSELQPAEGVPGKTNEFFMQVFEI